MEEVARKPLEAAGDVVQQVIDGGPLVQLMAQPQQLAGGTMVGERHAAGEPPFHELKNRQHVISLHYTGLSEFEGGDQVERQKPQPFHIRPVKIICRHPPNIAEKTRKVNNFDEKYMDKPADFPVYFPGNKRPAHARDHT